MRTLRTVLGPNHPPPPPPPPSCCEMPPFSDHLQTGLGLGGANGRLWEVHTTILCCMLVSHARTFLFIGGSPGGPFVLFFVVLLLRRNSLVVTSLCRVAAIRFLSDRLGLAALPKARPAMPAFREPLATPMGYTPSRPEGVARYVADEDR